MSSLQIAASMWHFFVDLILLWPPVHRNAAHEKAFALRNTMSESSISLCCPNQWHLWRVSDLGGRCFEEILDSTFSFAVDAKKARITVDGSISFCSLICCNLSILALYAFFRSFPLQHFLFPLFSLGNLGGILSLNSIRGSQCYRCFSFFLHLFLSEFLRSFSISNWFLSMGSVGSTILEDSLMAGVMNVYWRSYVSAVPLPSHMRSTESTLDSLADMLAPILNPLLLKNSLSSHNSAVTKVPYFMALEMSWIYIKQRVPRQWLWHASLLKMSSTTATSVHKGHVRTAQKKYAKKASHPHIKYRNTSTAVVPNNHARQVKVRQCPHSPGYPCENLMIPATVHLTG